MTIAEAKKRLNKAIQDLNQIQTALVFEIEETEYSIGFTNHGRTNTSRSYGTYSQASFFDEYRKKADAYVNTMKFAELIIAASELNNPKAYHNFCEQG